MRRCFFVVALMLPFLLAGPMRSAEDKGPLAVGKNLPATFHPYNVNARVTAREEPDEADKEGEKPRAKKPEDTTKGRFHCLITEYDLEPVVMLFARNLEENPAFRDLLVKLDGAIDRNPGVRLRAFVAFVSDDIKSVLEEDDKREQAAKNIQKVADDLKLKNVVLTLASEADVAKFGLDKATALTAVLYKQLRIEATHAASRDKLDKADAEPVKAILADVAGKLKATR
jgi:hypothetical protein